MTEFAVAPRKVLDPWERHKLEGSRPTRVGRESRVTPEPGPLELYRSVFPTRRVDWDYNRQLFVIYDSAALGWREFVLEWVAWPDPVSDDDDVELEKLLGHLPRFVDQGQRYFGGFRPFSYPFVRRRMQERRDFLALGSAGYSDKIAAQNRAIGKKRIRDTANDNAARLRMIRRWFPVLAGDGKKIPLVPVGIDLSH